MKMLNIPVGLFKLGNLVASPMASASLTHEEIIAGLRRHQAGAWGDLEPVDQAANTSALMDGRRIMSHYTTGRGQPFWILTEADRSTTTVFLPEEY